MLTARLESLDIEIKKIKVKVTNEKTKFAAQLLVRVPTSASLVLSRKLLTTKLLNSRIDFSSSLLFEKTCTFFFLLLYLNYVCVDRLLNDNHFFFFIL